jgi:hypothetical protein
VLAVIFYAEYHDDALTNFTKLVEDSRVLAVIGWRSRKLLAISFEKFVKIDNIAQLKFV